MADTTIRYVGDNDPMKLSASDVDGVRTDLPDVHSISILAVNVTDPTDTITGTADVLDPPEDGIYNHQYAFADDDTSAPGSFHVYSTVTEADTTTVTTYSVVTLTIKAKV